MNKEILFYEKQRFTQWWLWIILLAVNGFFLFGIYKQIIIREQFGDKLMSDTGLIIITLIILSITSLFSRFKLETLVKSDGVYVRFFPLHLFY